MYISSENVYFIDIPLSGYLLSMNEVELLGFGPAAAIINRGKQIIIDLTRPLRGHPFKLAGSRHSNLR